MSHPFRSAIILGAAGLAIAAVVASIGRTVEARQGSATANMMVSANVIRKCTIQALALGFGAYDPIDANRNAPLDGQSTLTVSCTKGTTVMIALDNGANASGQIRRMTSGATEFLNYELFKDSGHSQRWGDTGDERYDAGVAPSRDPRQFIVYGRVAAGQDIAEGNFQDTVVVTVQF